MNLETPQSKSRAIWIGIAVIMASGIASGFGISFTTHQSLITLLSGLFIGVTGGILLGRRQASS